MGGRQVKKNISKALVFLAVMMLSVATMAGNLSIKVKDIKGVSAANAVITLRPLFDSDWRDLPDNFALMKQRKAMFKPFVLAVRTNTAVSFPNLDRFRHQVYSFSKAKRFELRLYGKDESKSITFDKAGVVSLGCNIHDNMLAYIYITDDPYFIETNNRGEARLDNVRPGNYEMTVWHPDQKNKKMSFTKEITIDTTEQDLTVELKMRTVRRMQKPADPSGYFG